MNRIHSAGSPRSWFLTQVSRKSLKQDSTCVFFYLLDTRMYLSLHTLTSEISLQNLRKGNTLKIILKIFAKWMREMKELKEEIK